MEEAKATIQNRLNAFLPRLARAGGLDASEEKIDHRLDNVLLDEGIEGAEVDVNRQGGLWSRDGRGGRLLCRGNVGSVGGAANDHDANGGQGHENEELHGAALLSRDRERFPRLRVAPTSIAFEPA